MSQMTHEIVHFHGSYLPIFCKTVWYATKLKRYSRLKNCLKFNNYNAALRSYTCTHTVYSLFNDIYNSECALAAVLLPSQLPSQLPEDMAQFISAYLSHRKLAINFQLGNFGHKQSKGLLIWKWWIEWYLICNFLYLTWFKAWISL